MDLHGQDKLLEKVKDVVLEEENVMDRVVCAGKVYVLPPVLEETASVRNVVFLNLINAVFHVHNYNARNADHK